MDSIEAECSAVIWSGIPGKSSGATAPTAQGLNTSIMILDHDSLTKLSIAVPDAIERFPREIYQALLIRKTEQCLLELFREGKLFGTVHTSIGQEMVGVSVSRSLTSTDSVFSNHRGHGHFLSYCENVSGLIAEVMGKSSGVCGGRGGSQHLQQDNYYSNGIQGGIAPIATGLGFGHKLKKTDGISVVYIGDGTLGQGVVYESMNIASKWNLPVLFVCENNLYAQSTSQTQTLAGDICARAQAFGIDTHHGNTWQWPELFDQIQHSIETIRRTSRPAFHRVDTFRLMAHSKGDDNRPEEYIQRYWECDPLVTMEALYRDDPRWQEIVAKVDREIETAVRRSEAASFGTLPQQKTSEETVRYRWIKKSFPEEKIVQSVNRGLREALQTRDEVIVIGEDIESPYGGAFKCTMGLSAEFPDRVLNTPISEHSLAGIGNGLALSGMLPIVEIMFGDFMTLTCDQWINHAAKFRFMFNDKVRIPVILRTPMGGKRGYAATHSQSIEKLFLGLPDTQVLCLHHRYSPAELYNALLSTIDRPSLVVENKVLYGQRCSSISPVGFQLLFSDGDVFPTARIKPLTTPDVTVIAIGGMSVESEQAVLQLFMEHEVVADLFLPSRLYPFDLDVFEESLESSKCLLIVEEGQGFASLSSEIAAQVFERWGHLGVNCKRVFAAPMPIPAARPLEQQCLPSVDTIVQAAIEVTDGR